MSPSLRRVTFERSYTFFPGGQNPRRTIGDPDVSRPVRLLFAFSLLIPSGCNPFGSDDPVEVRVRNGSTLTLDKGALYVHRDSITFTSLGPGQATPYQEVEKAYQIASTWVVTGSDTARLQVIDFVGEEPLSPGRYTYVLAFFEGDPTNLTLQLTKDR